MKVALARVSYQILTDDQLVEFLYTEEDRLPRAVVDEFLGRGERLIGRLCTLCRDERAWDQSGPAFWVPVHATLILGAYEDERALPGLLAALRGSTRYEVDWASERLPSLFGRLGRASLVPLMARARNKGVPIAERTIAIRGLAAVAARHPVHQGEVLDFLLSLAGVADDDDSVRTEAAAALLRFARPGDRDAIEAAAARQQAAPRPPLFDRQDVEAAYAAGGRPEPDGDPLEFYSPEGISARARRWSEEEEDARWERGVRSGALWVDAECGRFLTKYEFSLLDLPDDELADALWVAQSMVEYLARHEKVVPWRWNRVTAFAYLMDLFSRRVALDDPGRIRAVPDNMIRFARFCEARGLATAEAVREVEAVVSEERDGFLEAALDPERRREAREVLQKLSALGVDPTDPAGLAVAAEKAAGRKTSRRLRRR